MSKRAWPRRSLAPGEGPNEDLPTVGVLTGGDALGEVGGGAPAGVLNEGGALGGVDCGAPTGVLNEGGALGKAGGGAPETSGGLTTGGGTMSSCLHAGASDVPAATAMAWALVAASIASDSSGSETSPPAHEAAGDEPLPLPITT